MVDVSDKTTPLLTSVFVLQAIQESFVRHLLVIAATNHSSACYLLTANQPILDTFVFVRSTCKVDSVTMLVIVFTCHVKTTERVFLRPKGAVDSCVIVYPDLLVHNANTM